MLKTGQKLFTRVRKPKNAWAGPKIQHSLIDEEASVRFLERGTKGLDPDDFVYPLTQGQIASRWDKVATAIGVKSLGLQVRSLRGGGTVHLYERTQNIPLVYWRGRCVARPPWFIVLSFWMSGLLDYTVYPPHI